MRMDFFGTSGGRIARLRSITFDDLTGSPFLVVVTAALRTYSILVVVPLILAGRWPGRRKLNGKL